MTERFPTIGIFAKTSGQHIAETIKHTCDFLQKRGHKVVFDATSANMLDIPTNIERLASHEIGKFCDLVIVVGGDGSLLKAARAIVNHNIPILGVNRGNLGFLADVNPNDLNNTLGPILDGEYFEEQRVVLHATLIQEQKTHDGHLAINDIVVHHGDIARLIEFQVYINDQFVVDQRADGIIASTPTGSTAYALSGGGPIVYPTLDVLSLVPMFPHALNTRPIVIDKTSKIRIILNHSNRIDAKFSCDGQMHITLKPGNEVHLQANKNNLRLLHPRNYNYFVALQKKLGWNVKPSE
jgi:NAD+ kinase